ncbi:MAG: PAS domain S-box protein [Cyanobacteria bacterium J06631_2]
MIDIFDSIAGQLDKGNDSYSEQQLNVSLLPWTSLFLNLAVILLSCGLIFNQLYSFAELNNVLLKRVNFLDYILSATLGIVSLFLAFRQKTELQRRVQAELALKQSKAKYKTIIEDQTELICRYGRDSQVSYVNDAFCRYFGIEKEQLLERQFTPVIYEGDRERVLQLVASMSPAKPTITIENRVLAQGKIRWTQWNNRMIFDEAGNFLEYQAVGRDINPLKEIELKLRESEERFRHAFENAATGEALVDLQGKFIQVNRSLCETLGYGEAELLGKTFHSITHPEDLEIDLRYVQQLLAGKIRTYQMEKRYCQKSGSTVWALLSVSLVKDIDNQPKYFISQIRNINQRKSAEAKLNSVVVELERSNRELDEFASIVSHDLISPLHKQLILVDTLQEECESVLGESGQEYLAKIIGFNFKMEKLVRSLLTYARITTQARPFVEVALNQVLDGVISELEPEIKEAQATIEAQELPTIKGDRLQIHQLFLNLLQNALKFCSPARAPNIKISYQYLDCYHHIAIADNGIGFEPAEQCQIFIPFHRLHSYSKYRGTGLGLAICEKIAERHHGSISAQGKLGEGATFTVSIPSEI